MGFLPRPLAVGDGRTLSLGASGLLREEEVDFDVGNKPLDDTGGILGTRICVISGSPSELSSKGRFRGDFGFDAGRRRGVGNGGRGNRGTVLAGAVAVGAPGGTSEAGKPFELLAVDERVRVFGAMESLDIEM